MIVKTKQGYVVKSQSGKKLSQATSKAKAVKRLRQVEYFKHRGGR